MKKRIWIPIAAVLAFGGCTAAVASGASDAPAPAATSTGPASSAAVETQGTADDSVTYAVEGTGKATVLYQTKSGSTQKAVNLPWKVENVDADWLSVTATRSTGSSKIQCVIKRGDTEIARTEAEGQYSSCSATGQLFE